MDRKQFFELLKQNDIIEEVSFDDSLADGYNVRKTYFGWEVFTRDRGIEFNVVGYPSESNALTSLFEKLLKYYGPGNGRDAINRKIVEVKKEIAYREELVNKASYNNNLTEEERTWLVTHPLLNRRLGYQFYNVDIIKLKPDAWYLLKIRFESFVQDHNFIPVIGVSDGNGCILADFDVIDVKGNRNCGDPIKKIGFIGKPTCLEHQIRFRSSTGFLSVSYECDFFDKKTGSRIHQSSSVDVVRFAMRREKIGDNQIRYFCKSPLEEVFGEMTMAFTIEWIEEKG